MQPSSVCGCPSYQVLLCHMTVDIIACYDHHGGYSMSINFNYSTHVQRWILSCFTSSSDISFTTSFIAETVGLSIMTAQAVQG